MEQVTRVMWRHEAELAARMEIEGNPSLMIQALLYGPLCTEARGFSGSCSTHHHNYEART